MSGLLWLWLSMAAAFAQSEDPDVVFGAIEAPPAGAPLTEVEQIEEKTSQVASVLRCPVCQGLSVEESREGLSLAMKDRIREMVTAGYSQDQIIDYFVERYGEGIVLLPDERHWLVWFSPIVALLFGLGVVGWTMQSRKHEPTTPASSQPDTTPVPENADNDAALAAYRQQVLAALEED
ncbi:MAG: cytochrome c-type biogenesis protein [Myxococcota bacterium]